MSEPFVGVSRARYWSFAALYVVVLLTIQSVMGYGIDAFKELWGEPALEVVALCIVALGAGLALWIGARVWVSCTVAERAWMIVGLAVYALGSLSARYPQERLHYLGYGVLAGLLYVGFSRRPGTSAGDGVSAGGVADRQAPTGPGGTPGEAPVIVPAIYAFGAGGAIGYLDELLQILWPRRYFDWVDVGMNFVAVALGLLVAVPAWRGLVRRG